MKKMIKFIPLVIIPSFVMMACANAKNNQISQDPAVSNENGITEYTVTVDFNGGTYSGEPTFKVRKGVYYEYFKKTLPTAEQITYPGHRLTHYSLEGETAEIADTYRFYDDVTIVAQYEVTGTQHTVTWQDYNGAELDQESYCEGETPSYKGDTPTREHEPGGYWTFTGWDPAITPVGEDDVTYTAQYDETITEHVVTFDTKGGDPIASKLVNHEGVILVAPEAKKEGYVTTSVWYYLNDESLEQTFVFGASGTKVVTDMTLYCKWIPVSVSLSFNAGEGSQYIAPITGIEYNGTVDVSLEPIPTKEGYIFNGWWYMDGTTEKVFEFHDEAGSIEGTHITSDMTVFAKWKQLANITLSFKIDEDDEAYASWYCDDDPPVAPLHLIDREVSYGETGIDPTDDYLTHGHTYKWTLDDSKILIGWEDSTGAIYQTIPVAKENATYTAALMDKPVSTKTVTFHSTHDGLTSYDFLVEHIIPGECAIEPKNEPTEDWNMHDFKGWTNQDGSAYDFNEPIIDDTDIYAKFEESKIATLEFVDQDGTYIIKGDRAVGHPVDGPLIPYWISSGSDMRFGAIGWRDVDTKEEIKIVSEEDNGKRLEPIPGLIPFDFELDGTATDTGTQYNVVGGGSYVKEEFDYGTLIKYQFEKPEGHNYPYLTMKAITYADKEETIDFEKYMYYYRATGQITIQTNDGVLNDYKSIQITVHENE